MTKTKEELIAIINLRSGTDRTEELSKLQKYKLCVMLEETQSVAETTVLMDLANRMGSSVKREQLVKE